MTQKRSSHLAAWAVIATVISAAGANAQQYGGYQAPFDWTGFYAGIYGGLTPSKFPNVFQDNSLQGGVVAGYTMQLGPAVVGGEIEGSYLGGRTYDTGGGGTLSQHWAATAKLKAGVALDATLIYGTAGYGFARLDPKGNVISDPKWQGGWVFGGGIEQGLGSNLSAKLEYTQMRMDDVSTTVAGGARFSNDLVNHSIKAGINLRF